MRATLADLAFEEKRLEAFRKLYDISSAQERKIIGPMVRRVERARRALISMLAQEWSTTTAQGAR